MSTGPWAVCSQYDARPRTDQRIRAGADSVPSSTIIGATAAVAGLVKACSFLRLLSGAPLLIQPRIGVLDLMLQFLERHVRRLGLVHEHLGQRGERSALRPGRRVPQTGAPERPAAVQEA